MRGINKLQRKLIAAQKLYPDVSTSTRLIQNFDHRQEIRPDTHITKQYSLDPSTWIEIMVETVDRSDMMEKIVGFAYFPLFLAPDGKQTPFNANATDFLFNEGCHQIPIFYDRVPDSQEITWGNIFKLPKIMSATILLRSYPCARDKTSKKNLSIDDFPNLTEEKLARKGLIKALPGPYQKGLYNNQTCNTDRDELHLYKFKHKRVNPLLSIILGYLFQRKGIAQ